MTRNVQRQRGAALLVAMVVLTLVATLASGMVWAQWRALQVEQAERARAQAGWVLTGALDWARLILREDNRNSDHLGEPWAVPLAEARLSTFLAADKDNNTDSGPEAFLAGQIADAQALFNLRNLVDGAQVSAPDLKALQKLCSHLGLDPALADRLAQGLLEATNGTVQLQRATQGLLAPQRLEDLAWLGPTEAELAPLKPHLVLLPVRTALNLNTASRELLSASIEGLDLGGADRLVQARQGTPFKSTQDAQVLLPTGVVLDARRHAAKSDYFFVQGRLRLEQRVLEEQSLVWRNGRDVVALGRERRSQVAADR